MFTVQAQKLSLSAYDDKRYILEDGITTLPYGHFSIQDDPFYQMILSDSEWGEPEESTQTNATPMPTEHEGQPRTTTYSEEGVPDPGFHQPQTTDSDYDDEIADFELETVFDQSFSPNEFLDMEAVETNEDTGRASTEDIQSDNEEIYCLDDDTVDNQYQQTSHTARQTSCTQEEDVRPNRRKRRAVIIDSDSEEDLPQRGK